MNMQAISGFIAGNEFGFFLIVFFLILVLFLIVIMQAVSISRLKKRYAKMMQGAKGKSIEQMMLSQIEEVKRISRENEAIVDEHKRIVDLLNMAVTRIGVVRFRAFEDMGSDLSYAIAFLNSHDDGVVVSSIFGREDSRNYVKPIEGGTSSYALSDEEKEAIREARQVTPKAS